MQEVISKTEETIGIIDKSDIIKRLKELKRVIDTDIAIKQLLYDFNDAKEKYEKGIYSSKELAKVKESLYKHPIVSEYRSLYSVLNISFLKFNKKLSSLLNVKNPTCGRI